MGGVLNFGRVEVDAPRGLGSAGCVLDLTEVVPTLSSKEKKNWILDISLYWIYWIYLLVMEIGRYDAYADSCLIVECTIPYGLVYWRWSGVTMTMYDA